MSLPAPQANHFCTKEADAEQILTASRGIAANVAPSWILGDLRATPDSTSKHKKNNIFTVCPEKKKSVITMWTVTGCMQSVYKDKKLNKG